MIRKIDFYDPQNTFMIRKIDFYDPDWYGVLQNFLMPRHFFPKKRYKTTPGT